MKEKSDKVEIKSIRVNIGGNIIDLTIEQARELRGVLNGIFGPAVINYPMTVIHEAPTPVFIPAPICPAYPSWAPTCQPMICTGMIS